MRPHGVVLGRCTWHWPCCTLFTLFLFSQLENKDEILQCILCHFVFTKRKVLLDQLRDGLQTLGVLSEITMFPELLAPLFVFEEGLVDSCSVQQMLIFPPKTDGHVVRHMLLHFIDESSITGVLIKL